MEEQRSVAKKKSTADCQMDVSVDNSQSDNERHFEKEVLCQRTPEEIVRFFRQTALRREPGWKVKTTKCVFSRKCNIGKTNQNYYIISATFVRRH